MSLSVQSDVSPDPDVTFKLLSIALGDVHERLTDLLSVRPLSLALDSGQAVGTISLPTAGKRAEAHLDYRQDSALGVGM